MAALQESALGSFATITIPEQLTGTRTLIAGTSYLPDQARLELAQLWSRVARHLNPHTDIILIDSASPFDPATVMPPDIEIIRFPDNIGAISQGQRDGSGRAFCKGLEIAVERGYDYCMIWEADTLFTLPAAPIIKKMHRIGVKVAAPFADPYAFMEWAVCFWSTQYVKDSKFIERYDWEHAPKWPIPEFRVQSLVQDEVFVLPIRGYRNSMNNLNAANYKSVQPYFPFSFLTHCQDFGLYYQFLDMNGIRLT